MDSPQNHAESENASLAFSPAGEIETLELAGAVAMQGDGRSARAEKAVEVPARGVWILTGGAGSSATVESEGSRVSAADGALENTSRTLGERVKARVVFVAVRRKKARLVGDSSRPTYGKPARTGTTRATWRRLRGARPPAGASPLRRRRHLNDAERTLSPWAHAHG
jgi:hypothetical protein